MQYRVDTLGNIFNYLERLKELNKITGKVMLDEGRVYGGGMRKLEPKELSNVPVPDILSFLQGKSRFV